MPEDERNRSWSWWDGRDGLSFRYLSTNFPCRAACPVGTNAGGYVSLIAQDRHEDAYALARGPNPFASVCGRICAHPCEAACRRLALDSPISIRAMKRVVCERYGTESDRPFEKILEVVERPRPAVADGKRVAIVGAGPAGLSCAHDLALMGHKPVVFERSPVAGGMMRLGIPEYRLPREVLDPEIDFVKFLGVEIVLGCEIGRDVTFGELRREFAALFLAPGCSKGKWLRIPGEDLPGVLTAVDFLAHVNLGTALEIGEKVLVVGGGSVAFDVARSARRYGGTSLPDEEHHNLALDAAVAASRILKRDVTLVALESRDEMPADPREIEEGGEEGIRLVNRKGPRAILAGGGNGAVRALQTIDVSRVFDESGRFSPQFVPGSEGEIACDTVILAVGQVADLAFLGEAHGIETTPRSTVLVDRETLATSLPGVFAGGDVVFGPRIVIEAVADGRRAARSIDTHLTGRRDLTPRYRVRVFDTFGYDHPFARGDYETIPRRPLELIELERRTLRAEVEKVMADEEAGLESSRCLHCWVNTVFDSAKVEGTECIQCGGCVDICPEQCIDLVALRRVGRLTDEPLRLPDGAPLRFLEGMAPGAALLKDETACIRCGLCARRCPAGTITMQAFYREGEERMVRAAEGVL